ncbi:MAG: hypothetical protein QOF44_3067 [Streptomyces sp.]|nr:hypothetical protein [Streptomyces sp.]
MRATRSRSALTRRPSTTDARYPRLTFTGNTGRPAAQLGELEAYTS